MQHPGTAQLLRFATDRSSEEELLRVGRHVSRCRDCLDRVRALASGEPDPGGAFEEWTARAHDDAIFAHRMAGALMEAGRRAPGASVPVGDWIRRLPEGTGASFRTVVLLSRRAAAAVMRSIPPGCRVRSRPALRGVAGVGDEPALRSLLDRSRESLWAGRGEEAAQALLDAARLDARLVADSVLEVHREGARVLTLDANGSRGTILLRYWPRRRFAPRLFALVVPRGKEGESSLGEFLPVAGGPCRVAEFPRLPDDSYDVLVGPSIDDPMPG
jgi:hypothetical protein